MITHRAMVATEPVCIANAGRRILKSDYSSRSSRTRPELNLSGVSQLTVLSQLEVGANAILVALDLPPAVGNHLMYMGFVPEARIRMLRRAPAGDPTVYAIDGMEVALRHETADRIRVRPDPCAIGHCVEEEPELAVGNGR